MHINSDIEKWFLYVITDEQLGKGRSHYEIAKLAIDGGADVIQLRDKTASGRKMYDNALKLRKLTRETGVIFIVNDRVDIGMAVDADGVHVGQKDLPAAVTRKLIGADKILGVSAETVDESLQAKYDGADYVGVGPIFEARNTKPDTSAPQGLQLLANVRNAVDLPIVAIGGLNLNNALETIRAGADCLSVISAVVSAADIRTAAQELRRIIQTERNKRNAG